MHILAELARKSVEEFLKSGEVICPPDPLPEELKVKAGVFVCIKKVGELRGCIGTFMPCCDNVAEETIRNAISAATQDPRFLSVSAGEMGDLSFTVDLLSPPEKVNDIAGLDPREFGVIVSSGHKRGLLLPNLEGVDTVEDQLRITRMKAGIMPHDKVEIFRFRVQRFT